MAIIRKIREFLGGKKSVIHIPEAKVIHTDSKILVDMDAESIRKSEFGFKFNEIGGNN